MSWFDELTSSVSDAFGGGLDGFFGGGSSTPTATSSNGQTMEEAEPNVSDNSGGGFFGGVNDIFSSFTNFASDASDSWFGFQNLFGGDTTGVPESEPNPDYRPQQPQTAIPTGAVGSSLGFIKDNVPIVMAITGILGLALTFMMFRKKG